MWRRGATEAAEPRAAECPIAEACNALAQRVSAASSGPSGSKDRIAGANTGSTLVQRMDVVVRAVDRSGGRTSNEGAADALYKIVHALALEAGASLTNPPGIAGGPSVAAAAAAVDPSLLGKGLYAMHKVARAQDVSGTQRFIGFPRHKSWFLHLQLSRVHPSFLRRLRRLPWLRRDSRQCWSS